MFFSHFLTTFSLNWQCFYFLISFLSLRWNRLNNSKKIFFFFKFSAIISMWSAQVYVLKSVDFKEKHSFVSNFLSFGEKKQIRLKLLNSICVNFCHPKWKQRKVIELNFYWKHKNHFSIKMQIKSKKKLNVKLKWMEPCKKYTKNGAKIHLISNTDWTMHTHTYQSA